MTLNLTKPRVVIVTRKSPLDHLIARHGTLDQAAFYLKTRGRSIDRQRTMHARFEAGLAEVIAAIPSDQRRVRVDRADLDRFLFVPDDVVVVVGQDGLVPNVAKYLTGQIAIGVNPDPESWDGVLCRHVPSAMAEIIAWINGGRDEGRGFGLERRVMAVAERDDGQRLLALNELFIGHRTHQSARYRLKVPAGAERHSSSGIICATGTGSTGWARSIATQRGLTEILPEPEEDALAWFVREPFPSVATGIELNAGRIGGGQALEVVSEMWEGGVIFADGIESDWIEFVDGQSVTVGMAEQTLDLVVPLGLGQAKAAAAGARREQVAEVEEAAATQTPGERRRGRMLARVLRERLAKAASGS